MVPLSRRCARCTVNKQCIYVGSVKDIKVVAYGIFIQITRRVLRKQQRYFFQNSYDKGNRYITKIHEN